MAFEELPGLAFHDHPLALVSGVFYADAGGDAVSERTPTVFADPRGTRPPILELQLGLLFLCSLVGSLDNLLGNQGVGVNQGFNFQLVGAKMLSVARGAWGGKPIEKQVPANEGTIFLKSTAPCELSMCTALL